MKTTRLWLWLALVASAQARLRGLTTNSVVDEEINVIIKYKNNKGADMLESTLKGKRKKKMKKVHAVATKVTRSQLEDLQNDPDIEYVEEDAMLYPDQVSTVQADDPALYGLRQVQGGNFSQIDIKISSSAACSNPDTIRIGVVDSGLSVSHEAFAATCGDITNQFTTRCIGASFGTTDPWNDPIASHGTHVAGTIGGKGIGVIPDGNFCLVIGRVFGDDGGGAMFSDIYDAVEWMVDTQQVQVINMSLGGGSFIRSANEFFRDIRASGSLVIASAGNGGSNTKRYPASYDNVISTAAIDSDMKKASFSDYNDMVDIAAPGVDILSAIPEKSGAGKITPTIIVKDINIIADIMAFSMIPNEGTAGPVIDCGSGVDKACPGAGGHVCLIERGDVTFLQKATSCEKSKGVAALIYNSNKGGFSGTLTQEGSKLKIPVLAISREDGEILLNSFINEKVSISISNVFPYARMSGTSMASPHVAGSAALIWRACPACVADQVADCLEMTALDLGKPGKDEFFGSGLVQTNDAYQCLVGMGCCEVTESPTAAPTESAAPSLTPTTSHAPTDAPSAYPSLSSSPSVAPTDTPTLSPSMPPTGSSAPSTIPSGIPTVVPTQSSAPSHAPSGWPSASPTRSVAPSSAPSDSPTRSPQPSFSPSSAPSTHPTRSCSFKQGFCMMDSDCCNEKAKCKVKKNQPGQCSK